VHVSGYGSKNSSGGSSVAREPKWDLCLETRRGKCNRALRELERVPLGAKIASQCMLRLTLPCAQVARSPSAQVKAVAAYV
jgi:hypothetical protein